LFQCVLHVFLQSAFAKNLIHTEVTGWSFQAIIKDESVHYIPVGQKSSSNCTGFSYNESQSDGPKNWGNICPEWATCNNPNQSPINIPGNFQRITDKSDVVTHYQPNITTNEVYEPDVENVYGILNNISGSNYATGGPLEDAYGLVSFHFHVPSEHTMKGKRYDCEIHLVHKAMKDESKIAVIGVVFDSTDDVNSTLLQAFIYDYHRGNSTAAIISLLELFPSNPQYYYYSGSLTVPPCSPVVWLVQDVPHKVGKAQVEELKHLVGDGHTGNARPIQSQGERTVSFYADEENSENQAALIIISIIASLLCIGIICGIIYRKTQSSNSIDTDKPLIQYNEPNVSFCSLISEYIKSFCCGSSD